MARIGKYKEIVGTSGGDFLKVRDRQIAYGSAGDDTLEAKTDSLLGVKTSAILIGGFGFDRYIAAKRGVTIIIERGSSEDENGTVEDTLTLGGIGLRRSSSFVMDVDNRHLLVGDVKTRQVAVIVDWKSQQNQIEEVRLADSLLPYEDIVNEYKTLGGYLGNFSWKQLKQQGILDFERVGLRPSGISKAIRKAVKRADQLQGISPLPAEISGSRAIASQPFITDGQLPTSFS
jgi:hypothetical protein